jgi:nicotinate-nucleotide adenylyltransferase
MLTKRRTPKTHKKKTERSAPSKKRRIGLLGGSFNPAHEGHLHLSLVALKMLKLDEVWWLLSPKNPLKSSEDLAPYTTRLAHAKALLASHSRLKVSDFEKRAHLRYTRDTLELIKKRHPNTAFVWLMGADNLPTFHRWHRWQAIFRMVPVAVFDRAPFSHSARSAPAALAFAKYRQEESQASRALFETLPAWVYIFMKRHPLSSTFLRKTLGKGTFLGHNNHS